MFTSIFWWRNHYLYIYIYILYIYPIGSMYGVYANIWGILMVNVAIYCIHGSYGYIYIYISIKGVMNGGPKYTKSKGSWMKAPYFKSSEPPIWAYTWDDYIYFPLTILRASGLCSTNVFSKNGEPVTLAWLSWAHPYEIKICWHYNLSFKGRTHITYCSVCELPQPPTADIRCISG